MYKGYQNIFKSESNLNLGQNCWDNSISKQKNLTVTQSIAAIPEPPVHPNKNVLLQRQSLKSTSNMVGGGGGESIWVVYETNELNKRIISGY